MSAKTAQQIEGPIIHGLSTCGNRTTVRPGWDCRGTGKSTTLDVRFWAKVDRKSDSECWPWLRCATGGRYGYLRVSGKAIAAHRLAWELANGRPIPAGLLIRHSCDNKPCCNPAHLLLGTQKDNVADAISRGRHRFTPMWQMQRKTA